MQYFLFTDLDSPTADNVSSGMLVSDDGQTADDEGTMGRTSKLRIPSVRRIRKSPTLTRRETDKRAPRERKRKGVLLNALFGGVLHVIYKERESVHENTEKCENVLKNKEIAEFFNNFEVF